MEQNQIYIPHKLLALIDSSMEKDQGATYRGWLGKILPLIGDAYSTHTFPFRSHLGASGLGAECTRSIYYGWRWAKAPSFQGRILRLFNRGHLEEGRVIATLLTCGLTVYQQDVNGKQFRISSSNGHVGGSGDGVVTGVPDAPQLTFLLEIKTHSVKSFAKLKKEGLRLSKKQHFVQMQLYMHKFSLRAGLYYAVCKDTDEIYLEMIMVDRNVATLYLNRGDDIVNSKTPPMKLHNSIAHFDCKYCDFSQICHRNEVPDKNCRTCKYAQPVENANWLCTKHGHILETAQDQFDGCNEHERLF